MAPTDQKIIEKKHFLYAMFIPLIICVLMLLSFLLEHGMNWNYYKAGIYPRSVENLWGIFTYGFVHANWGHLLNNIVSFFILGSCLYYFYNVIASQILIYSYLFSGLFLWFIGRESWHIGISSVIYSLAFFLFFSGIIRKYVPLIAISLIVVFIYGSMVWYLLPFGINDSISWEGHLSGGLVGIVLSIIYRKKGPQKPEKIWEEEEENEEEYFNNIDFDDRSHNTEN